jgi:hypothetical protein
MHNMHYVSHYIIEQNPISAWTLIQSGRILNNYSEGHMPNYEQIKLKHTKLLSSARKG